MQQMFAEEQAQRKAREVRFAAFKTKFLAEFKAKSDEKSCFGLHWDEVMTKSEETEIRNIDPVIGVEIFAQKAYTYVYALWEHSVSASVEPQTSEQARDAKEDFTATADCLVVVDYHKQTLSLWQEEKAKRWTFPLSNVVITSTPLVDATFVGNTFTDCPEVRNLTVVNGELVRTVRAGYLLSGAKIDGNITQLVHDVTLIQRNCHAKTFTITGGSGQMIGCVAESLVADRSDVTVDSTSKIPILTAVVGDVSNTVDVTTLIAAEEARRAAAREAEDQAIMEEVN